jgi:hypothetical protein
MGARAPARSARAGVVTSRAFASARGVFAYEQGHRARENHDAAVSAQRRSRPARGGTVGAGRGCVSARGAARSARAGLITSRARARGCSYTNRATERTKTTRSGARAARILAADARGGTVGAAMVRFERGARRGRRREAPEGRASSLRGLRERTRGDSDTNRATERTKPRRSGVRAAAFAAGARVPGKTRPTTGRVALEAIGERSGARPPPSARSALRASTDRGEASRAARRVGASPALEHTSAFGRARGGAPARQ